MNCMERRTGDQLDDQEGRRGGGGSGVAGIMRAIEEDDLAGLKAALVEESFDPTAADQ